jgi:hypothetical protein
VEANSLYECDNTYQLINFYHATLNYPVVSTLVKAINKGYLKGFAGLTSRQVCQHIKVKDKTEKGTWTNLVRVNDQQKQPPQQGIHCHSHLVMNQLTPWNRFPKNP